MFKLTRTSADDTLIDVVYRYSNTMGSVEVILYQRPDGTYYERISNYEDAIYQDVSCDGLTPEQKLKHLRDNREEILRQGNALDFALLVDQLEQTVRIKRGNNG